MFNPETTITVRRNLASFLIKLFVPHAPKPKPEEVPGSYAIIHPVELTVITIYLRLEGLKPTELTEMLKLLERLNPK